MNNSIPLHMAGDSQNQPERSDAIANRARILAVTRTLFAKHGPSAVSMSDIVKAAKIGRGTLYRHYPNKGELCLAVMNEEILGFQQKVLAEFRALTAVSTSAMTQLDYFLDQLVHFTERYAPLLQETEKQGVTYMQKKGGTPQQWQQTTVLSLLQRAQQNGEIKPGLDLLYMADAVLAPLNANLFQYQRLEQDFSPERISIGLRQFVSALHA